MSTLPAAKKLVESGVSAAELHRRLDEAIEKAPPPGSIPPPQMEEINVLAKASWLADRVEAGATVKDAVRSLAQNIRNLEAARAAWVQRRVQEGVSEPEAKAQLNAMTSGKAAIRLIARDGGIEPMPRRG